MLGDDQIGEGFRLFVCAGHFQRQCVFQAALHALRGRRCVPLCHGEGCCRFMMGVHADRALRRTHRVFVRFVADACRVEVGCDFGDRIRVQRLHRRCDLSVHSREAATIHACANGIANQPVRERITIGCSVVRRFEHVCGYTLVDRIEQIVFTHVAGRQHQIHVERASNHRRDREMLSRCFRQPVDACIDQV